MSSEYQPAISSPYPRSKLHHDAPVAYDNYQEGWEAPALTYSGASSPASSTNSPLTSPSPSTPQSVDPEPFIPELLPKAQQAVQSGHIPRPRNAFIIFRSYFYSRAKATQSDINQNELSCAAASAWKTLPEEQKKAFRKQAEDEKLLHYKKHPNYVYAPVNKSAKRVQKAKATSLKNLKQPSSTLQASSTKKRRSSLSQRAAKADSQMTTTTPLSIVRVATRVPESTDSDCHSLDGSMPACSTTSPAADRTKTPDFAPNEKIHVSGKTEDELLKRVDHQFGIRPDASHTMLPPMPDKEPEDSVLCDLASPVRSEEIANPSPSPLAHNTFGYPDWMYNELIGFGKPDTGLHAGWNPIQMILHAYGDNYFSGELNLNNDYDEFSQYINYDNMDTTSASDGAASGYSHPNGAPWDGLQ